MIINLDESRIRTIDGVRAVLDGTRSFDFTPAACRFERYEWITAVLVRLDYRGLKRVDRGRVRRYLQHLSGFSRAQITRAVQRWLTFKPLCRPLCRPANAFARRYTAADLDALAEVEREYGRLSGPATVVVLRRMYQLYGDERFVRLQHLSASHLYNLRRSVAYQARHTMRAKTRPDRKAAAIAARRAPAPDNRPGFIRIDSVHQGDFRGRWSVYHINAVDCVTQWQVVATVPSLKREHMLPTMRAMLAQFPFEIRGFHSDGGSEYVNYEVAQMLDDARIDFTRSRPRRCNDNALVEAKNGVVVRRQFGYSYIPAERAEQFNAFCEDHLNPFLNLHRPCLFGTEVPDTRKPGRLRRVHRSEDVQTPLQKLASLSNANRFMRPGITVETLQQQAMQMTDLDAARGVRAAREAMMQEVGPRRWIGNGWGFAEPAA
ncbi:transposase family protein [Lysobacter sp. FW306-1B-D06B]|uniref:transposase family protein n=1 Tax=Lysobacter sp. FW306-1B-D06B TaxID=3140250 RepID=UPI0031404C66